MDRFRNTRQPDWDWWGRLWPTPGATLRELGIETGDALAEVGSGNGDFALPAVRMPSTSAAGSPLATISGTWLTFDSAISTALPCSLISLMYPFNRSRG